jgi:hypothetical protein
VLLDERLKAPDLRTPKASDKVQPYGIQPKLCLLRVTLDVYVRCFRAIG